MYILVLNSGSSSLKYKLFSMEDERVLASGVVERIGSTGTPARVTHQKGDGDKFQKDKTVLNHQEALRIVLDLLLDAEQGVLQSLDEIGAIGHRVLHGAEYFTDSVLVDDQVLAKLEELRELGPLHMPANIMGIRACRELMPKVKQVATFDTAFHQTMPRKAFLYAVPYQLYTDYRVRRYGFHGTSHRYVTSRTAEILKRNDLKIITLHLGNGSSVAAVDSGKVLDTSMGFTPLEGLVMGTRSGDLDPAIVPFIGQKLGLSPEETDAYLNKKSGFLGVAGYSDMRDIQKMRAIEPRAEDAYQMFIHRLVKYVGAYIAVLKGLDALVFTAGIGENDWLVREDLCRELEFMGVKIDPAKNTGKRGEELIISAPDSKVTVMVIPTNEELMIARDAYRLVR
ncbi:MAG TPA: acetate kinase [Firmicutes bacterium]|nr:acetate kinase [Bacillota bacterium]HOQ23385.1 acetate kinase [Bacillota bacterium]HPT66803.1 acetate kinase [Bacillota bacterium]